MSLESSRRFKVIGHIIGWLIFFITPVLFSPVHSIAAFLSDSDALLSISLRNLLLGGLFYLNLLYITPTLLPRRGLGTFLLVLFALVVSISLANYWIHQHLAGFGLHPPEPPRDGGGPPRFGPDDMSGVRRKPYLMLAGPMFSSLLITALVAAASTFIVMWNNWQVAQEQAQERTLQKVAAELSVLKLQISPHFLFNTLNNIRWLVRTKSDHAETAIVKLSQLLRYILYQTHQDYVSLDKEVENLKDFINLQEMRLSNRQSLHVTIQGPMEHQRIVPLLFIPLVENIFKYGDFDGSFVNEIRLDVTPPRLRFQTINKIIAMPDHSGEAHDSGIGLENVRKRLALHYPDQHLLSVRREDGIFRLDMEVILR